MKHGKKYQEVAKLVDRTTQYEPVDAIALVKKNCIRKVRRDS
jgi:large subunit ribosomal protein L1